ncbi:MAG: threonylcarbamoyl-AMP synthase [Dehalococcoidia bacterium]|nr:threonylcarbamoyl-AMP synthase [Dehalococcoidia bacterium]
MNALQGQVKEAVQILKKGGVIVFPTDTVYGLGADAFNSKAVERIYEIKKRPRHLPLPLLLSDVSQVTMIAESVPDSGWFLASRFWPGGLTLVLPKAASLPTYLTKGPTVAVRVPNHPICLAIIKRLGRPIIGTSANISGRPSSLTADKVKQQLGGKVDLIIDGGKCPGGGESTIVDVIGEMPVVLRQGIITQYEIDKVYREYCEVRSDACCSRL